MFTEEFLKTENELFEQFAETSFPPEITARFNAVERIGFNSFGETFVLSEKNTEELYVLKSQKNDETAGNEAELLRGLEHEGLPSFEKMIEDNGTRYTLRRYIEGESLSKYLAKIQSIDPAEAVSVMLSLCDVLEFLHSQPEPIIHRDIKPSNIIINPENGKVTLIDFVISRKFSESSEYDTVYFGTHKFAPPEQYGFAQTDCRSDIYSLGVVLRYWLKNTTNRNAKIPDKALKRIVAKCTKLDPEARYQTVTELKKDLAKNKNRARRRTITGIASAFSACLLLVAGFAVNGYFSDRQNPIIPEDETPAESAPFIEIGIDELKRLAENNGSSVNLQVCEDTGFSYVEGQGLLIFNRRHTSSALSFKADSLAPGDYIFEIEMTADTLTQFVLESDNPPHGFFHMTGTPVNYEIIKANVRVIDDNGVSRFHLNTSNSFNYNNLIWSIQDSFRMTTVWIGEDVPYPDFIIKSIRIYYDEEAPEPPPYVPAVSAETVNVQLAVYENINWSTLSSDAVTITGDGEYKARIDFDGEYSGLLGIGIAAEGIAHEKHDDMMEDAALAPSRFHYARIRYESVIINDEIILEVNRNIPYNGDSQPFVTIDWFEPANGYVYSQIWNAWYEPDRLILGAEAVMREGSESISYMFTVPGVDFITSIEVVFTIRGVEGG